MAITVIGGLLVSTLLTLLVIPVVYSLLDRKHFATTAAQAGTRPALQHGGGVIIGRRAAEGTAQRAFVNFKCIHGRPFDPRLHRKSLMRGFNHIRQPVSLANGTDNPC